MRRAFCVGMVFAFAVSAGAFCAALMLAPKLSPKAAAPTPTPQWRDIEYSTSPLDRMYSSDAVQMKIEATIDWIDHWDRNSTGGRNGKRK